MMNQKPPEVGMTSGGFVQKQCRKSRDFRHCFIRFRQIEKEERGTVFPRRGSCVKSK